jgi:hypothetical protein
MATTFSSHRLKFVVPEKPQPGSSPLLLLVCRASRSSGCRSEDAAFPELLTANLQCHPVSTLLRLSGGAGNGAAACRPYAPGSAIVHARVAGSAVARVRLPRGETGALMFDRANCRRIARAAFTFIRSAADRPRSDRYAPGAAISERRPRVVTQARIVLVCRATRRASLTVLSRSGRPEREWARDVTTPGAKAARRCAWATVSLLLYDKLE